MSDSLVQEACLELLDRSGKVKFRKWYKSKAVAQQVKCKCSALQKTGDTWVIWAFDNATSSQVLLWSSRPLGWRFVPVA